MSIKGKAYIAGVFEHPTRKADTQSLAQLHAESAMGALADAGLTKDDVDGYFCAGDAPGLGGLSMADYMGLKLRHIDTTETGGSSYVVHVGHAAEAIAAGKCDVALITLAGRPRAEGMATGTAPRNYGAAAPDVAFEYPYGPTVVNQYAMAAMRHMHEFGTTSEQLAEVAVATRKWATLNPRALMRDPLTIDEVLSSRLISWPLRLLDCCLVTDAGGAVVVTSAERARDCRRKPVYVLGTGEASTHVMVSQMPDFARWDAARLAGERAFEMAGVTHADVDVAQFYDAFTIVPIMGLEALGFCQPGEGGPFVAGQRTAPGGDFPMNTNGGGLSYTHSGMYGMFTLVEAVRQLRGESGSRQVADARIALCHGLGGMFSAAATLIAGTEVP